MNQEGSERAWLTPASSGVRQVVTGHLSLIATAAVLVALMSSTGRTQPLGPGLGVMLGEPTGVSAKVWLSGHRAVDAALAWSVHREGFFRVHADLLLHDYDLLDAEEVRRRLPVYYGVGGRTILGKDDEWVGVRFPLGVSYLFREVPFDVFFELVPILDLLPETDFDLDAAIGGRFYFGSSRRGSEDLLVDGRRF